MISRQISGALYGQLTSKSLLTVGFIMVVVLFFLFLLAPVISKDPSTGETLTGGFFKPYQPPSFGHLMGTNNVGQDLFTRVLYGGRVPLAIGILATILALSVGTLLGTTAGYRAGRVDKGLSIFMDSMYAFPGIILAIAITALLGPNILNTTIAVGVIYIPSFYRLVRGQTLQLKEVQFVEAARSLGESSISILRRYILPNLLPSIVVLSSLSFADAILIEAGLSFVGLPSVSPPAADWGLDITIGRSYLLSGSWWMVFFPGIMIILTVLAFSFIGEGLNDLFDTDLRQRQ